jgi:antitoxin component of RelBE/YafQ-DinJ toxin-antitoxin module
MSKLKSFVNKKKNKEMKTITARIELDKYTDFKRFCDSLGLSINEAINILIDSELKPEEKSYSKPEEEKPAQIEEKSYSENEAKSYSRYEYDSEDISEEERAEIAATCEWVDETPEWLQKQLDEQAKPTVIEPPVNDPSPPILKREEIKKERVSKYR